MPVKLPLLLDGLDQREAEVDHELLFTGTEQRDGFFLGCCQCCPLSAAIDMVMQRLNTLYILFAAQED